MKFYYAASALFVEVEQHGTLSLVSVLNKIFSALAIALWGLPLAAARLSWNGHLLVLTSLAAVVVLWWLVRRWGAALVAVILVLILSWQAQWGISQFIVQRDAGLSSLGEAQLAPELTKVAKFTVGGEKVLRAYGPYRHANVLGGVMAAGFLLVMLLWRKTPAAWTYAVLLPVASVLLLGVALSFSRAAYLGAGLAVLLGVLRPAREQQARLLVPLALLLVALLPLLFYRATDAQDVGISERLQGYSWAAGMLREQPIWRGSGQPYEAALASFLHRHQIAAAAWQIDFVHSVPLLLAVQVGVGPLLLLFMLAMWLSFYFSSARVWIAAVPLLPMLLLDHYFLTQIDPLIVGAVLLLTLPQLGR